jgi:hypothetical protein
MAMRALMRQTGGFCASGGPYQIAAGHQCSSGQTALLFGGIFAALLFGGIFAMLIFGGLYAGATGAGGGPGSGMDAGFLMWTALFGSLGFNFLSLAIDPPSGQQGAGGWIISGVVFELMALGGLVPLIWSAREWVMRGGAPEPPLFKGPAVRAAVNENVVYEGVPGIACRTYDTSGGEQGASSARAGGQAPAPSSAEQPAPPLPKRLNIPRRDWGRNEDQPRPGLARGDRRGLLCGNRDGLRDRLLRALAGARSRLMRWPLTPDSPLPRSTPAGSRASAFSPASWTSRGR